MKTNYFLGLIIFALLVPFQAIAQVDVTFKVDMTGQTVNANGVHVVGSINGWNTNANQLSQEGETNIYSTVIQLNEGWHEYKFLNGNAWGTEEQAGYPCAASNGNRFVYINNSGMVVSLEAVPFNGCNASGTGFELTFNVDMASEGAVPSGNVHIAGGHNGWNGDNLSAPNVNGNIHSATLRLPTPSNYPVTFEYKYVNNSSWETPDVGCATVMNTNRIATFNNSGNALGDVFNGCNYSLSIKENALENMQVFYENSTKKLVFNQFRNLSKYQISLYDLTSKLVKSFKIDSSIKAYADVSELQSGLYIVRLFGDQAEGVKKVVIN